MREEPKVGDRVRVTGTHVNAGCRGVVKGYDAQRTFPYKVQLDGKPSEIFIQAEQLKVETKTEAKAG